MPRSEKLEHEGKMMLAKQLIKAGNEYRINPTCLNEIGSQGVVSEILSGKRSLNVGQISRLAKRFHVSPGVFLYCLRW